MKLNAKLALPIDLNKKRCIVFCGVLGWGLLTAALYTVWSYSTNDKVMTADIVIPFTVFPSSGVFCVALMSFLQKKSKTSCSANSR